MRDRGLPSGMHPRLTVVPVNRDDHVATSTAVRAWARTVDAEGFQAALHAAVEARRDGDEREIARLEADEQSLGARLSEAEARLEGLVDEQRRILESADWCEAQPEAERTEAAHVTAAEETIEIHRRRARDANQQLERVLEQRAAADAALEEARQELADLSVVEYDETDVRRQTEQASHLLRDATAKHRDLAAELAECRAEVEQIEATLSDVPEPVDRESVDQFRLLQASIRARLTPQVTWTQDDLEAARARMTDLRARVDEASAEVTIARQRVQGLETELTARSRDNHSLGARKDAAVQLEAQVRAVEERLREAEAEARAAVDDATREVSRVELTVERLRSTASARRRQLRSLANLVPEDRRLPIEDDLLGGVDVIAGVLRDHAAGMDPDIRHAASTIDADRTELARRRDDLRVRREGLGVVTAADRAQAVAALLATDEPLVIDVLVDGDRSSLTVADLDAADPTGPVIVLTDDPEVLGWAIEVPADRGAVVPATALRPAAAPAAAQHHEPDRHDHESDQHHDMEHHTS